MTVESATKPGEIFAIPDELIEGIGRSKFDPNEGRVFIMGGICYRTRESFGELAEMIVESCAE